MATALFDRVLSKLPGDNYRERRDADGRRQITLLCPGHEDTNPSLAFTETPSGTILFHCFAPTCQSPEAREDILRRLGLAWSDLSTQEHDRYAKRRQLVATWKYVDEEGTKLYAKHRWLLPDGSKSYTFTRADGKHTLKGCRRLPYRLDQLVGLYPGSQLVIVEGEKCVDAVVETLGLPATCNPCGAGKWSEIEEDLRHEIPKDLNIVVVPDNDAAGRKHAIDVAADLHDVAREVRIVELPDLPEKGDVVDWIEKGRTANRPTEDLAREFQGLVTNTDVWNAPPETIEQVTASEKKPPKPNAAALATEICTEHHFTRDAGRTLYGWRNGVYRSNGSKIVDQLVKGVMSGKKEWSSHLSHETARYIEADASELWETPPIDQVNVGNGILDLRQYLRTGRISDISLTSHTPEFLSPVQLPVSYDPQAECPRWKKQVADTFPDDAQELAWEIIAWLMLPYTGIQKAILFLGEGGTGKSTYLAAVRKFLGRRNIATKSLHRLEASRFSVAGLYGKLANICADLPSEDLAGTSIFKAITGGDELTGEHKFKDEFSFLPFCRLVFSANKPPRSTDSSEAFFERWIVVPFDKKFRGTEKEVSRQELDSLLADPQELSGVLNKALLALPSLLKRGFTSSKKMTHAHEAFRTVTDPVIVWLEQSVIDNPDACVAKVSIRQAYNANAKGSGRPIESDKSLGTAIKRWRPDIKDGQRNVNGRPKTWCWLGIGLRSKRTSAINDTKSESRDSLDSRDKPHLIIARKSEEMAKEVEAKNQGQQDGDNPVNLVNPGNEQGESEWRF